MIECGYLDFDYKCMKDGKPCKKGYDANCQKLKADKRGMKELKQSYVEKA
jgi:hypothetical protein